MNVNRLHQIIEKTTTEFRKGPKVTTRHIGSIMVQEVFSMPHEDDAPKALKLVDVHFLKVGVDIAEAAKHAAELGEILRSFDPQEVLASGPSYITLGFYIGSQGAALRLFALGEALGLWAVITPVRMGITDEAVAADMAGSGFVMMSGLT